MNKILFSFLITFLAGISTVLGVIPCYFNVINRDKIISFSLAFSAGIMLTISFISLIPEGVLLLYNYFFIFPMIIICLIFVVLGILISFIINTLFDDKYDNKLYKLGIVSIIVLILHNIPEGITTFISTSNNLELGLSLSLAIALHNIPEGISIAVPIYFSSFNRKKAFFYTFISGFSELFGAIIAYLFISKYINNLILGFILCMTAGIMIQISIYELLPNSFKYKKNKTSVLGFALGIFIMIICKIFI